MEERDKKEIQRKESLEEVQREMVDCMNSIHAKFDIMATATEAGDGSEVSLRTIRQLSTEGLESIERLMDLWGEQERLTEAAK